MQRLLSEADRALGRLDGSLQTLPHPDPFVYMYVRKEAVLSSQIEGTQSSLQDLLAEEAHVAADDRPRDVEEVVNYVRAMNHGLARLAGLPVSVRLIREIHAELLSGVRGSRPTPGELRRTQNWIGPGGCTLAEATFLPPPPDAVPGALGDLEKFLHAGGDLPLLVQIGLAHAQFETIHPFLDGNGRVGRLLITFLLCEKGALRKPVLYLSHYFKKHRQAYYELLQAVRDRGAFEEWLASILRGPSEFFRVDGGSGYPLDGWLFKPPAFDSPRKYPVLFYIYSEPRYTVSRAIRPCAMRGRARRISGTSCSRSRAISWRASMGLPQQNADGYRRGSPITFAKNLRGNLLLVHGSGDDNVHFQNSEALIDALVAANKPFTMMDYPGRTRCICEGEGTTVHLFSLLTRYLEERMPAGR
jgi:fido (protein-threonine AMPylation protein)